MSKQRFNRVHAVCEYLNIANTEFRCKRCPAWEDSVHGKVQRGCYALADEACSIATNGNPWGKSANSAQARRWRKRFVEAQNT